MPKLTANPTEIQTYLTMLAHTLSRINACTGGRDEELLRRAPDKKTWSAFEILMHLRGCEEVWTFSIYAMLAEDNPALPLFGGRDWMKVTKASTLTYANALAIFALHRAELLDVLRALPEASWSRTCTIEGRQHSVFSQARRMALHEAEHCDGLEALMRG